MPACVAIGTLVSMLSRQSLQHKTKACICHTRRRNNQRTFWVTFNPSRNKGSWEMFEILTHSHDKLNNVGGNNQQSIKTRAKPPRPPHIRVILSDCSIIVVYASPSVILERCTSLFWTKDCSFSRPSTVDTTRKIYFYELQLTFSFSVFLLWAINVMLVSCAHLRFSFIGSLC